MFRVLGSALRPGFDAIATADDKRGLRQTLEPDPPPIPDPLLPDNILNPKSLYP